jgi:hypothetical protein
MSDDVGVNRCESEDERSLYTAAFLPINHKHAASMCDGVSYCSQNLRSRINCNRDISVRRNEAETLNQSSSSFRLCVVIALHIIVICNGLVTSVNCDELLDAVGSRGHYVNTFAVHIPGGEAIARSVADDHGFHFRGRVS